MKKKSYGHIMSPKQYINNIMLTILTWSKRMDKKELYTVLGFKAPVGLCYPSIDPDKGVGFIPIVEYKEIADILAKGNSLFATVLWCSTPIVPIKEIIEYCKTGKEVDLCFLNGLITLRYNNNVLMGKIGYTDHILTDWIK